MIPLIRHTHYEGSNSFPVHRLWVDGMFDSVSGQSTNRGAFAKAIVDTGSPYVIIRTAVHKPGLLIHQDLGKRPFRIGGAHSQQPFAEVTLRFLTNQPVQALLPVAGVQVKAYLLDKTVSLRKVVIGMGAIEHFTLHIPPPPGDAFLLEPGEPIP